MQPEGCGPPESALSFFTHPLRSLPFPGDTGGQSPWCSTTTQVGHAEIGVVVLGLTATVCVAHDEFRDALPGSHADWQP